MAAGSEFHPPNLEPSPAAPVRLGLPEAMGLALGLHQAGRLDDAQVLYQRVLAAEPEHADALHFMGVLTHQRGRSDEAATLIRRSIAHQPGIADWHNNLGNVLLESGRVDEAGAAYEEAARLAPERADVHNNLGVLRREQKRPEDSEAAYRRAIALDPTFVDAHTNLGNLLHSLHRNEAALISYCEALALRPQNVRARQALGMAYYTLGRFEEATRVYADWLRDEPESPQARHHLAACSGRDVPARAADDYVAEVFDGFAGSFDAKLAHLHYRAPQLLEQEVRRRLGPPRAALAVLDAGCGTGLCGPLLRPWARRLQGVDLSAGMLARAEPRGVYDGLEKAELTAWIAAATAGSYDLIVSADTLCYFGDLAEVCRACASALTPGGWLMFTVEALDDDAAEPVRLNPHGRYGHRADYLRQVLAGAGLGATEVQAAHLRTEGGRPVAGWLVSACKAGEAGSS